MTSGRGARGLGGSLSRNALLWIAAAVVLLVVLDVVLVAVALGRTAPQDGGQPGPIPTFTSTPSPRPTPSASSTAAASAPADAMQSSSGRHLLTAVDGSVAWRASAGVCGGSGEVLQHTTDGGASWQSVRLGDDVESILALRATSSSISMLVAAGPDCEVVVRTSADDGATWSAGTAGAAGAGIGPDGLVLKTGTVDPPCSDPTEVFQGDYTTAVICQDVMEWRSGTGAWVEAPMQGIRSLADAGDRYTIAVVGADDCDGVQIASVGAAKVTRTSTATAVGCDADADTDGAVTVARSGTNVWVWAGKSVAVSSDGGATW
ncbi:MULTISPECIES: hypothetical protein [unclassified Curtobacterium]|uniref:hypothetical protein n=1 Tax=unclassified Curtobacterium TaxID=257496 RepID=UPI00226B85A8|nr:MULTISPECIES: hypothetical protein [unclassified Curtobacterium]